MPWVVPLPPHQHCPGLPTKPQPGPAHGPRNSGRDLLHISILLFFLPSCCQALPHPPLLNLWACPTESPSLHPHCPCPVQATSTLGSDAGRLIPSPHCSRHMSGPDPQLHTPLSCFKTPEWPLDLRTEPKFLIRAFKASLPGSIPPPPPLKNHTTLLTVPQRGLQPTLGHKCPLHFSTT